MPSAVSRARDFVARFISDDTKFDTSDVVAEIDQVEQAAKDASTVVDRQFADMGESADQFAREVATAADRMRTELRSKAKLAGGEVNTAFRDTGKETGKEVGAELASNIGEGIRGGDWQATASNSMQGLAAGFAAIPVVGIGLAIAAGIGGALIGKIGEEARKAAETGAAVFTAAFEGFIRDKGIKFPETALGDAARTLIESLTPGELGEDWQTFSGIIKDAGLNVEEVAAALLTGGAPAQELVDKATELRDTQQEVFDKITARILKEEGAARVQTDASVRLREQRDTLGQQITNLDTITGYFGTVAGQAAAADTSTTEMKDATRLAGVYAQGLATNLKEAKTWAGGVKSDLTEVSNLRYASPTGEGGKVVRG